MKPITPHPSTALARFRNIGNPSCPRGRVYAVRDTPMERRVGPIPQLGHEAVLRGVEVNVIHMRSIIAIVPDRMFPEPPLPDATLAFADPADRPMLSGRQTFGEARLDNLSPGREIRVTVRQCPDAVHMLR